MRHLQVFRSTAFHTASVLLQIGRINRMGRACAGSDDINDVVSSPYQSFQLKASIDKGAAAGRQIRYISKQWFP
ncbi:hypothetical protein [Noviherbaspirillum humi]|uniref:hypothetical protein n=1 Tax=Noviherbaspirillum humi TaxID=1688639 RepID=UPI0011600D53|nr:hypothetical protein [Noviherbaspirillum humi]